MHQDLEIQEHISLAKSIEEEIADQTQAIPTVKCQKSHNDQHIFYSLKTSAYETGNPSIFSVTMKSAQANQRCHDITIKSRQNLRNSMNIKTSMPQNSFESEISSHKINSPFKRVASIQRAHKKIEIKNTEMPEIKLDSRGSKSKIKWTDNSFEQTFKMKRKNSQRRRNYFNVKQLMQFEAQKKKDSAIILLKNTSNNLLKRKKQKILGKVELSPEKVKQFQFNAIQITKNIVEKSYGKYGNMNKIRSQDKRPQLKPNKSYNEGLNGQKKQLISVPAREYLNQKLIDGIYEQRGSLWRSNSYQLPRSKQMIPSSTNRTASIRNGKRNENYGRSVQFDQNIDLNPWSMGHELNFSNLKTRYAVYKTQNKHQEQEHDFLNYYIKTSRQET